MKNSPSFDQDLPPSGEHPLFIEMAQFCRDGGREEWREAARWVKYEEDIEEGGQRWSKPYVSAIHLSALNELRGILENNCQVHFNLVCGSEKEACQLLVDKWLSQRALGEPESSKVLSTLLKPHAHLYETTESSSLIPRIFKGKTNPKPRKASLRPDQARRGSILSVVYQPQEKDDNLGINYLEIGRAMGTLLTDPGFKDLAYSAESRDELVAGIDQFLNTTSILPPAIWDASIRLEPHEHETNGHGGNAGGEQVEQDDSLARSGKLFRGLYKDLQRKIGWYPSDFRDAISLQVLSTWMFLYFACLTPMITFGGLMGEATHKSMGTMETIVSGCVCGIGFALFAGQPLLILGSTGPVLVFEKILVSFAESNDLNYLEFRLWVGLWISAILMVLVALDASSLVQYITRFTEDNFATLIALIFMFEAVKNVVHIKENHITLGIVNLTFDEFSEIPGSQTLHEVVTQLESETGTTVFLMSLLLFFGTFFVTYMLKEFRISPFLPTWCRYLVSDFAVILAIACLSVVDYLAGIPTPKLEIPENIFAASIPALLATILIFMDQQITAVIVNRKDHKLQKGCGYHLDLFVLALLIVIGSLFGLPWFVAATVESLTNIGSLKMESETAAPGEKPKYLGVREQRVSNLLVFTTVGLSVLLIPLLKNVPMPVLYGVFLYMGFSALMRMDLFSSSS
ncbi:Electroneutral sodium bicarbonate exchanger 1 [Folsomia candida]|uniref:Electroneutral sodium bicarbonate exchanger 1 n=1 Tax=Folsomia candida TaxID=158441 RepID=A0A226D8X6_FOLCA|nr:Electroneutral sodium bicarbonate exchanger 1 [Folsomia candida]